VAYSGTAGSLPRVIAATISAATTAAMFETALQLRAGIRDYLQRDPAERGSNRDTIRSLNEALKPFPLAVELRGKESARLKATREGALAGLSQVVAELYNGSRDGTLDRLKMCASDECRRLFFDRSKPATRRWCMSTRSAETGSRREITASGSVMSGRSSLQKLPRRSVAAALHAGRHQAQHQVHVDQHVVEVIAKRSGLPRRET